MADNRAFPINLSKEIADEIIKQVPEEERIRVTGRLSNTCQEFYYFFKTDLNKIAWKKLAQAVIDDDRKKVTSMLNANPYLLLVGLSVNNFEIESQYTWQRIYAEDVLMMAVKRKQIRMIELLLPHYNKLEQELDDPDQKEAIGSAKALALSNWSFYEMHKNENDEDEIVIPQEYTTYLQSLIDIFANETFPNGTSFESKLSDQTEEALRFFRKITLPSRAIKLDDYFDPEIFLYAFYKLYAANFIRFQNWDQRDHFCVKVGGWIQSLLSPEAAKIFCEGLYYVVKENRAISAWADSLKLRGGESFYRLSRDSLSGIGGKYLCVAAQAVAGYTHFGLADQLWKKNMLSKSSKFLEIYACNDRKSTLIICPLHPMVFHN